MTQMLKYKEFHLEADEHGRHNVFRMVKAQSGKKKGQPIKRLVGYSMVLESDLDTQHTGAINAIARLLMNDREDIVTIGHYEQELKKLKREIFKSFNG